MLRLTKNQEKFDLGLESIWKMDPDNEISLQRKSRRIFYSACSVFYFNITLSMKQYAVPLMYSIPVALYKEK